MKNNKGFIEIIIIIALVLGILALILGVTALICIIKHLDCEVEKMNNTNCLNCGAPLHFTETDYGRTSTCEHCGTEYHIDELGRVEEYKVKIKIMGKVEDFYISDMNMHPLTDSYWDFEGKLHQKLIKNIIELNLISY